MLQSHHLFDASLMSPLNKGFNGEFRKNNIIIKYALYLFDCHLVINLSKSFVKE